MMESGALVSIIIPVYNVKPYLAEALDNVLCQTYRNLEILIIDDGSTDGSGEVCNVYAEKDKRIHVIHQENRGLSAARNTGLNRMSGEAVAFLDADDAYLPDYVKRMLDAMIREDVDVVVCRYSLCYTTGKMIYSEQKRALPRIKAGSYDGISSLKALADGAINVNIWNKLYRRELWENTRFPEGHVYEDSEVIYRVFDCCRNVYVLDDLLYLYRKHSGSITETCSQQNYNDMMRSQSFMEALVEERIPRIFSSIHLERRRLARLRKMIRFYLQYSQKSGEGEIEFAKELREQIIAVGEEYGIENYGLRTRVVWKMICRCPTLLKTCYAVYVPVWRFYRIYFKS